MLKLSPACSTCKLIREEGLEDSTELLDRIYKSKAYNKRGETLRKISKELAVRLNTTELVTYNSILRHTKYHQGLKAEDLANAKIKARSKKIEDEQVRQLMRHGDVRQRIMDKGLEQIESGEVKLTASTVLGAANKEADIEDKQKDRNLKMFEMINQFRSGEIKTLDGGVVQVGQAITDGHDE